MSDDHDLRSRLERLASSAGDPPEHGLDRVAARRHRRLHRRRGAVATAAVLAVLVATLSLISTGPNRRESVTADDTVNPATAPAAAPRIVEVRCEPTGIVVPVASVRPQSDGLHLRVVNSLGVPTRVEVDSNRWSSGPIVVEEPMSEIVQPVPPGVLNIGCEINGQYERRRVDLVDSSGYYEEPELDCEPAERTTLDDDLPVTPPEMNLVTAVREGMAPYLVEGDAIKAVRGYVSQRITDPTDDPVVQVVRRGDTVGFVHVRGDGGASTPPWTVISFVEACSALTAQAPPDSTTTPSTVPTLGEGPPV